MTNATANDDERGLMYAEYQGIVIGFRRADRYVNATALLKTVGKQFASYWKNAETQAFLSELSLEVRILTSGKVGSRPLLVEIGKGHRPTWVHPRVAWHLGQWASPELASWVTGILDRLSLGLSIMPVDQQRAIDTFATKADLEDLRLVVNNTARETRDAIETMGWRIEDRARDHVDEIKQELREQSDATRQGLADVRDLVRPVPQIADDVEVERAQLFFLCGEFAAVRKKRKGELTPGQRAAMTDWLRERRLPGV